MKVAMCIRASASFFFHMPVFLKQQRFPPPYIYIFRQVFELAEYQTKYEHPTITEFLAQISSFSLINELILDCGLFSLLSLMFGFPPISRRPFPFFSSNFLTLEKNSGTCTFLDNYWRFLHYLRKPFKKQIIYRPIP